MTSTGDERERELAAPRVGRVPADTLSNRLTLARKLAGLSIRDAADLCGYGRGAWTNWEKGARPLDYLEVTGIVAEKLDVDVDWLRFGGALAPARGVPVTRKTTVAPAVRAEEDRLAYSARTERPPAGGPKGRGDRTHPLSGLGSGRRPVRVGSARAAEVINLA